MKENRHLQAIPSTVLTQALGKINEVKTLLSPYLVTLTPAERQEIPKMGPKTLDFVEKAHDFALENPTLVPAFLNLGEFTIDFTDAHGLWTLLNAIQQLEEAVDDTEMVAGSESYQSALVFYKSVKMGAEQNVLGAKAIYDELRPRFPRGRRHTGESETETETVTETIKRKVEET
jgi:hypothetical protein